MTTANVTQTGGAATVAVTVSRGLQGATGADGPSNITTSTATTIHGLIKGNGSTVLPAVAGTDFAAPSQVKSTSFAAANLGEYIAVATLTVTDPSPSEGASFRVLVRNGTATVGGTAYSTAGTVIERVFHSGAWANYSYQIASTFETPAGADAKITAERTAVATLANKTLSSPVLGTPASGTLTNCTGLPQSGVVDLTSGLAAKANLASPTFTGTPTLPTGTIGTTQTAGNSTTALATTAFVTTADNLKANIDAQTHTGAHAFSSTTRPTSAGTGTPAATSLITAADRRTEEVVDLSNVYYRQIMGHELGAWVTVGISPSSAIEGNNRAGCRFIGTTGLSSASAQGGGIKYPDAGITGGATFFFTTAFDLRFLFRNSLVSPNFDVAHFLSLRNNTNFWSASSIGLYHVAQPTATWAATTAYTVGNRINVSGIVYVCSTAGTSGVTQPTFNATINGTANDGTAVWRTLGPHTSDKWALAFVNAAGDITLTDTGVAWVAGTSNTTALRLRSDGTSVFASVNGSSEVSVARGALLAATPYIMCRGESATDSRISGLIWTVQSANI